VHLWQPVLQRTSCSSVLQSLPRFSASHSCGAAVVTLPTALLRPVFCCCYRVDFNSADVVQTTAHLMQLCPAVAAQVFCQPLLSCCCSHCDDLVHSEQTDVVQSTAHLMQLCPAVATWVLCEPLSSSCSHHNIHPLSCNLCSAFA
jgi:hypothetical protein